MLGFEANGRERRPQTPLVQKRDFIKVRDRTQGQKERHRCQEERPVIPFQGGRGQGWREPLKLLEVKFPGP